TTGSEIVTPGRALGKGQIYNSNTYSISGQVLAAGAEVIFAGIVADDPASIKTKIGDLLDSADMVLISGGVSMGDFDFVPGILKELGVELHFSKVAIQPGKPTVFGTHGETVVFGLPGNPVSTFTIFEIFVKRVLCRMMGLDCNPVYLKGEVKKDFTRRRTERTAYVPVKYNNGDVAPLEYHGSAHIAALSQANAVLQIPAGVNSIKKGTIVNVRQI
ncbi:MAG: molybdopterin molybdotransferase MoeA, partial [bacterium]|nr:molybdopterin molybdotransferase MoeA [bacterium]